MELNESVVGSVWDYVERSCPELLALFDELDLNLTAPTAGKALHFADGAAFARWLSRHELPPYHILRNWWYVVEVHRRSLDGQSLYALAAHQGRELATLSRFVVRITGERWSSLKLESELSLRRRAVMVWAAHRPLLIVKAQNVEPRPPSMVLPGIEG